jgi:uncharacterized protein (TIGR03067 family)
VKKYALLIAIVGLVIGADNKEDAAKTDLKRLEGDWVMVSGEQEGEKLPEQMIKESRVTMKGNTHTVKLGDETIKGTHKLDPTKKPKTIDVRHEGASNDQPLLGIYELKGDEFKVCFAAPGKERPTEFTSKSGTGQFLHIWKRQKK